MAKWDYIVYVREQSGTLVSIAPSALDNVPCERWTHDTAVRYARTKPQNAGATVFVDRRRSDCPRSPYLEHRVYRVDDDGIARRVD